MLIISNPASGHKNGPKFIENYVLPLLDKYHVSFKLETTNAPKHAGELAKNYLESLGKTKSAVILVSGGDGTIHEIINGLESLAIRRSIVIIHPLRSPQVSGDTPEERAKFAQILMGSMNAARNATHTHIRYPKDKTSSESPSENADGPLVVQYYRCGGWEWTPDAGADDASCVCADGSFLEIREGEWAKSEITALPTDHGVHVFV
ncbi:hypothetical protein RSAG8_02166, partial [Rhizoctonia solani AG-8 WAC10335]